MKMIANSVSARMRISSSISIGIFLLVTSQAAMAQWTNGTNINNTNSGNVGIGTANPISKLQVNKVVRIDDDTGSAIGSDTLGASPLLYLGTTAGGAAFQFNGSGGMDLWQYSPGWGRTVTFTKDGKVGIGTTTPNAKLQVSAGDSSFAVFGPNTSWGGSLAVGSGAAFVSPIAARAQVLSSNGNLHLDAGTGQNVYIAWMTQSNTIINGQSGNVGIGTTSPGSGYKLDVNGNTNVTGNLNVTGTINAKYQDVAEWVPSFEQLAAGTVAVLDSTKSNQVTSSTTAYDTRVAGVISAQPGITLGEKSDSKVLVATTGRVRVKVDASRGPIAIGDLLVTSDVPGFAMKSEAVNLGGVQIHRPGTIIGKALEPLEKGKGEILALLSLQ